MTELLTSVMRIAAPLLFAATGALATEYAGVLAVFLDGAITLSAFLCIVFTVATGNATAGFVLAALCTTALVYLFARFSEATRANPFLVGLAFNLAAAGGTSILSAAWFGTASVIALNREGTAPSAGLAADLLPEGVGFTQLLPFLAALCLTIGFYMFTRYTRVGLNLRISGSDVELLEARGVKAAPYRALSWAFAGLMASCAGASLALGLGAYVPFISAGRGWTALAIVYLGMRHPLGLIPAVAVFAGAEYAANYLQGSAFLPESLLLALPYTLALAVFLLVNRRAG